MLPTEAVLIEVLRHIRHVLHMEAEHDVRTAHQLVDLIGLQVVDIRRSHREQWRDGLAQLLEHRVKFRIARRVARRTDRASGCRRRGVKATGP